MQKAAYMLKGTVKWFNELAGFGYIQQDNGVADVFVYLKDVEASGLRLLQEGQSVTFDITQDRLQPCAVNIKAA